MSKLHFLGQVSTAPVVVLKRGHRIRARFVAPAPCALIPPPAISAAMQALGAQAAVPSPWTNISFEFASAGIGCRVTVFAVWSAQDTVIDPELATLPGVGALPVEEVVDETTGQVLYDLTRQERPAPPGPAPAPPPRGSGPPGPTASKKTSAGVKFLIGAGALAALAWALFKKR